MTKDEALKLALEALEDINSLLKTMTGASFTKLEHAAKTIKEALQSNEHVEPVAWRHKGEPWRFKTNYCINLPDVIPDSWEPLFTHPPVPTAQPEKDYGVYWKEVKWKEDFSNPVIDVPTAQPEQEPVGEMIESPIYYGLIVPWVEGDYPVGTKLYTTPPQRKPLTDEELDRVVLDEMNIDRGTYAYLMAFKVARAIEAAHGIKENT